ncbi:hypothetical protein MKW92_038931 [Papaver armeniacum]|nr:hypothetical protein MKW92_038931 [Papaver armeniacum]
MENRLWRFRVVKDSYKGNLNIKSLSPIHSRNMEDLIVVTYHGTKVYEGKECLIFRSRISAVMSILDSPQNKRELHSILHGNGVLRILPRNWRIISRSSNIFEVQCDYCHLANTQDETLSSWSGFFQQDGARED